MAEFGTPNPAALSDNESLKWALLAFGGMTALLSFPSGAEITRALALTLLQLPNSVTNVTFRDAAEAWDEFAEKLDTAHDDMTKLIDRIAGGDEDLWSGPGAEAFHKYAGDHFLKGIDKLSGAAKETAEQMRGIEDSIWFGLIKSLIIGSVAFLVQITLQVLRYAKVTLPAFISATWISTGVELLGWADLIWEIISGLQSYEAVQGALGDEVDTLEGVFGKDGDELDQVAADIRNGEIPSISDPDDWSKES